MTYLEKVTGEASILDLVLRGHAKMRPCGVVFSFKWERRAHPAPWPTIDKQGLDQGEGT